MHTIYPGMRVAYPHNVAEDVAVGPSLVLGYCLLVHDVELVFRVMLECCSHGDLYFRASTTFSCIEQWSELRVHLEDGLLLRDIAGREAVIGDTVSNLDASVSSDIAVFRQLESFGFKLVDYPGELAAWTNEHVICVDLHVCFARRYVRLRVRRGCR